MKLLRRAAIVAASLALPCGATAFAADEMPLESGDYVEVSAIEIDDGHMLDYANHLAGLWRKGQDYAKSQGWITGYEVLVNAYPRKGEPDVYLLVRVPEFADRNEEKKRDAAYRAYMQRTVAQLQAESGERAKYRRLGGTMLLRQMTFKN